MLSKWLKLYKNLTLKQIFQLNNWSSMMVLQLNKKNNFRILIRNQMTKLKKFKWSLLVSYEHPGMALTLLILILLLQNKVSISVQKFCGFLLNTSKKKLKLINESKNSQKSGQHRLNFSMSQYLQIKVLQCNKIFSITELEIIRVNTVVWKILFSINLIDSYFYVKQETSIGFQLKFERHLKN